MHISNDTNVSCIILLQSDVNSVCFADESGNVLYSGSDDNLCKVKCRPVLLEESWYYRCDVIAHYEFQSLLE